MTGRSMSSYRCVADLAPRTETLIGLALFHKTFEAVVVEVESIGLMLDVAIPLDAEICQVGELAVLVIAVLGAGVEIFDSEKKSRSGRSSEQPRNNRCPEVAEVQLTGRTRRKSTYRHSEVFRVLRRAAR